MELTIIITKIPSYLYEFLNVVTIIIFIITKMITITTIIIILIITINFTESINFIMALLI